MGMILLLLTILIFQVWPLGAFAFFLISLITYCAAKRKDKYEPGGVDPEKLRAMRSRLIISGIILGAFLAVFATYIVLIEFGVIHFM